MNNPIWVAGFLVLLLGTLVMAPEASPQGTRGGLASEYGNLTMDQAFTDVDRNGDKVISESELREAYGGEGTSERAFSELDRDADGVLSEQEYMLPGNTGEVVSPGENPYEALHPGESGAEPLPKAEEYGITRERGTTGGVSPIDDSTDKTMSEPGAKPRAERGTERTAKGDPKERTTPYGAQEERGPENYELNGEMGDQEGRGPAEVPNAETYGSRGYDTTPEYAAPPVAAQGSSGIIDPQDPARNPKELEN